MPQQYQVVTVLGLDGQQHQAITPVTQPINITNSTQNGIMGLTNISGTGSSQLASTIISGSPQATLNASTSATINSITSDPNAVLPIQFPTSTPGVMHTIHVPLQSLQNALQSTGQTLSLNGLFVEGSKQEESAQVGV